MRPAIWILFTVTALAQWAVPLREAWVLEDVAAHGDVFRFDCQAPDPSDLLRGRYLAITLKDNGAPPDPGFKPGSEEEVFARLGVDKEGFAYFSGVGAQPPASGPYLRAKTAKWWPFNDKRVVLQPPFDRFYLNEQLAPQADEWFSKAVRDSTKKIWVEVRVKNGLAVVTDLKQDGRSFRDILRSASP